MHKLMWRCHPYVDGALSAMVGVRQFRSLASICPACWCGRFSRWPRWVSRRPFQSCQRFPSANGSLGVSRVTDRSITPSSFRCKSLYSRCLSVATSQGMAASAGAAVKAGRRPPPQAAPDGLDGGEAGAKLPAWSQRYGSPVTIIFQAMRAFLFASATAASFGGLRASSAASHGEAAMRPRRTCVPSRPPPAPAAASRRRPA